LLITDDQTDTTLRVNDDVIVTKPECLDSSLLPLIGEHDADMLDLVIAPFCSGDACEQSLNPHFVGGEPAQVNCYFFTDAKAPMDTDDEWFFYEFTKPGYNEMEDFDIWQILELQRIGV